MKKTLRFFAMAVFAMIASSAFAANEVGYKFSLSSGNEKFYYEVLTVYQAATEESTEVYGTLRLYKFVQDSENPVTEIGSNRSLGFKLSIGSFHVVEIADEVFKDQTDIKSVASLSYLTKIGASAFEGCTALTTIGNSSKLTKIGASAFEGCTALETFSPANACTNIAEFGDRAFYGCTSLYQLGDAENSVKFCTSKGAGSATVGESAFEGCTSITRLANTLNLAGIGENAFKGCTALNQIGKGNSDLAKCADVPATAFDECPFSKVTVGSTGFATFTAINLPFDFSNTNIKAYKASVSGTDITLTRVNTVTNGEGVLLYAEGGAEEFVPVKGGTVSKNDGNAFVGVTEDIEALASEDNGTNYILNDGVNGVGFYLAADKAVAAGKAYLKVPAEGAKNFYTLTIVDDEMTTGISEVKANALLKDVIYSISGQRVGDNYKGVVIVNGKKVLKK